MNAAFRCYVDNTNESTPERPVPYYNENLVFVFDTETTTDTDQDLLFGSCGIWENGELKIMLLFHVDDLHESKLRILREYAQTHKITLITKTGFVKLLYTNVLKRRAVCVGYNLPFDISRIACKVGTSKQKDKNNDSFSLKLTDNIYDPRITIKHINSKSAFIGFTKPFYANRKRMAYYGGTFVDLRTLTFALTNESHTLGSACIQFKTLHQKMGVEEHGKITPEYIDYNINDVLATYDLYIALSKNFESYGLDKALNTLWSPASIGKGYLKEMNIKSFGEMNPNFPKGMLGHIMLTYYGGRSEVHIRKTPVKITYLDFTSMYPSVFELLKLWSFIVAEWIDTVVDNAFAEFVDSVTLETFKDRSNWSRLTGIALVEPNDDILPVRAKYGNKIVYNIGINYVKGTPCYWTYADIIASKILTGKTPKIIEAHRFVAVGVQKELKPTILFGKKIDPSKDDFIKTIIEHRIAVKKLLEHDKDNTELKNQEHIAKIIASSTSYGIFAEINTIPETKEASIYGLTHFKATVEKNEQQGKAFHPLLATWLTAGARLILAMTEAFVAQNNGYYAYTDTDSMFVNPELVDQIKVFFKQLNPYSADVEMFKVEKTKEGKLLHDVWFYGISSKRYCLYEKDKDNINILKYSSSAIGNIVSMPKGWEIEWWTNILLYHEGKITKDNIKNIYKNSVVASKLAITSPLILRRFTRVEDRGIKPFNFVIVGMGYRRDDNSGEPVVPMIPYTKNHKTIQYTPFMDYKTGKEYTNNTQFYWKPLSEMFFDYINHKEEKYDGDNGVLRRKHVIIDNIEYIGKESNNLEETEITGVSDNDIVIYDNKTEQKITDIIKNLTLKQARKIGISKRNLRYLKMKLKNGKKIVLKRKTLSKLLKVDT